MTARPGTVATARAVEWYHRMDKGLRTLERFAALSNVRSPEWLVGMSNFYGKEVAVALNEKPEGVSQAALSFYMERFNSAMSTLRAKLRERQRLARNGGTPKRAGNS